MKEVQDKLRALRALNGVMTGAQWQARASELEVRRASGAFEIETVVPGTVMGDADSGFYLVRRDYALDTPHGCVTLGDALSAAAEHVAFSAKDKELLGFNPRTAVFVDTETTGLAGGTGTVTFLVGAGYFEGDVFRLDQCFMRDYDDEEAMLAFLGERFAKAETIVSYNGKSFDSPLLRTRFIANRVPFHLDGMMHYDLVHAARRFWKRRLGDCSLGNVERMVLGIRRVGDVDSSLIPQLWLAYLHTRDARKLGPVFYHHETDILSLVSLTAWLSQSLGVADGEGFAHQADRLSLVRVHYRQKRYEEVVALGKTLLQSMGDDPLRHECLEMIGLAAKRLERWEVMEETWVTLTQESPRHLIARKELAIHYEHRTRDLVAAERMCVEAMEHAQRAAAIQTRLNAPSPAAEFRGRLARIRRKLGRDPVGQNVSDQNSADLGVRG